MYDGSTAVEELNGANQSQLYRLAGIGFVKNGAQYYSEENAQGSSVATLDSSGAQMDGTEYDAYGLVWRQELSWGTPHSDYRWVGSKGYVTDDDTGMDLLGDRYYLPATGRFLTADPIGHGGGLNLYEYCDDNPLTRFDPSGHGGQDNRPLALIILGDRSDVTGQMLKAGETSWVGMEIAFKREGYRVETLRNPTHKAAMAWLAKADAFYFFGHGSGGSLVINSYEDERSITNWDLKAIADGWHRTRHSPMTLAILDACESLSEASDHWAGVAGMVFGDKGGLT